MTGPSLPSRHRSALLAAVAWGLAIGCADAAGPQQGGQGTINLNSATTFQTISGWEATDGIGQLDFPQTFTAWRDAALDSAAALGINRIRLQAESGNEIDVDYFTQYVTGTIPRSGWGPHRYQPVNDNANPNVINTAGFQFSEVDFAVDHVVNPLRQRLAARGETLYVNLCFVHATTTSTFDHKTNPAEYGEFMLAAFQHLDTKYGWVPDGVELILEPDALTNWTGTEIGQVLAAAGQRLSAAGYTPEFIGPSTSGMNNAVPRFDAMMAVPGASQWISELSYHRYFGVSAGALQTIASRASQRGIGTSMLEHIGSDYKALLEDLVVGMGTSWEQFTIAYPTSDNGAQYYLVNQNTNAITIGSRTKFLGQIFRYVRRLAVRIGATTGDPALAPVAFINPGNSYVVVVDASAGREFSVSGLPAGTYGVTYTTTSAYGVAQPDETVAAGGLLVTSIPQAGLLTIFKR